MITTHFLDELRGLTWPANGVVRFGTPGVHQSRVRGPAPEFSEYRAFRQGDDPRRLDWKVLARTDRAYLRLTEDRATLGTFFLLDASASMAFPDGERSKWRVAAALATGLAHVVHASGDPVGVSTEGDTVVEIPLRTRHSVTTAIAEALQGVGPGGCADVVRRLARRPLPGRVVVVSDFLDEHQDDLAPITSHMGRGGEVHAVRIIAAEELDPPQQVFTAFDPESPGLQRAFGPSARENYRRRLLQWGREVAGRWRASGAFWHEVHTDEPLLTAIRRVIGAV